MARPITPTARAQLRSSGIQANWLIESHDLDLHYYTYDTAGLTGTWEPRIESLSYLESSSTPGGGLASVASFRGTVTDDRVGQSLSAIIAQSAVLLSADLEFSLLLPNETYADRIRLFTGVIAETEHYDVTQSIYAVDSTLRTNRTYPRHTVDRVVYVDAPDASIGQRIPLLYGDSVEMRAASLLLIDVPKRIYLLAGHPVSSFIAQYAVWPEFGTRYVERAGLATTDPTAPFAQITLDQDLTQIRFGENLGSLSISRDLGNLTDPAWAIDGQPVTQPHSMQANEPTPQGIDTWAYVGVAATFLNPTHLNTLYISSYREPVMLSDSQAASAQLVGGMFLNVIDTATQTVLRQIYQAVFPARSTLAPSVTPALLQTVIPVQGLSTAESLELFLYAQVGGGGGPNDQASCEINTMILARHVASEFTPIVATNFQGKHDDGAGTITGTPNAVITNPADVIRDVIVNEIGDTVDATSFDAARTYFATLGTIFFDGGIGFGYHQTELDKRTMLDDLARQCRSHLFRNGAGDYALNPYDPSNPPIIHFDLSRILYDADPVNGILPPGARTTLRINRGRLDRIYNTFEIQYAWHVGKQQFDKTAFVKEGETSHPDPDTARLLLELAGDSIGRYGETETFRLPAYWIARDSAANALLEHFVTYFWSEALFVTFQAYYLALEIEVGDNIRITHPRLPPNDNGELFEVVKVGNMTSRRRIEITGRRVASRLATYFQILDQTGRVWYWWVNAAGELATSVNPPDVPDRSMLDLALSPTPSWLEIVDDGAVTRYVHPNTLGEPIAAVSAPAVGTGLVGSPTVIGTRTGQYQIFVTSPLREVEARQI